MKIDNRSKLKLRRNLMQLLAWLLIYALMVGVAFLVPVPGSDWMHHFEANYLLEVYAPWVALLPWVIPGLPYLTALTLTGLLYVMWRRRATTWQAAAVFTAMPLYWCIWLGQIDIVPVLGLAFLPWGLPLALAKPQVTIWYLWVWWRQHRRRWIIALAGVAFLGLSLLIWGWWPGKMVLPPTYNTNYNLSAWRIHWILGLGLALAALFEKDADRAMALGALAAPYVQGNSYLILLPVLSRLRGKALLLVWLSSWTGVLAVFWDVLRPVAMAFPIALWLALFIGERAQSRKAPVLQPSPEAQIIQPGA